MIAIIDAGIVDVALKGLLMEASSAVSTVSPWFRFDINHLKYDLKISKKSNFEIIIGQVS